MSERGQMECQPFFSFFPLFFFHSLQQLPREKNPSDKCHRKEQNPYEGDFLFLIKTIN